MRSAHLAIACVLAVAAAPPIAAQNSGAFIIRLGRDTTAVERYTRTGNRLEGEVVARQPRTSMRRFVYELAPDGRPTRMTMDQVRPGSAAGDAPIEHGVLTVTRDSIMGESHRDTATTRVHRAAPAGVFVLVFAGPGGSFVAYEMIAEQLHGQREDSISVMVVRGSNAATPWRAGRLSRDSIWIYDGNNRFHAHVDQGGHILHAIPLSGTQQLTVERVPTADIAALASAFAARDQQGQPLGLFSPRDTVNATAGGVALWIDYSRPSKRGRVIFGSTMVPYGAVWRTGANAATQFRTDKALAMGGVVVPAGFYTLWTVPSPGGWKLLINSQTGQWGTAYDASKDIFALDMTMSALSQSVERFTITVVPSAQGGILNLDWDTTRASIPFTVR